MFWNQGVTECSNLSSECSSCHLQTLGAINMEICKVISNHRRRKHVYDIFFSLLRPLHGKIVWPSVRPLKILTRLTTATVRRKSSACNLFIDSSSCERIESTPAIDISLSSYNQGIWERLKHITPGLFLCAFFHHHVYVCMPHAQEIIKKNWSITLTPIF